MSVQMRHSRVANAALKAINDQKKALGAEQIKEYKTRTKNFPVMLLQSGLAQSLGFLFAKAGGTDKGYESYKKDFLQVLRATAPGKMLPKDDSSLHRHIIQADLAHYRQLSHYAQEAAGWLKRIADTAIQGD